MSKTKKAAPEKITRPETEFELKGVKQLTEMSEETECFVASIYWDGEKIGTVENTGKGGPNTYHFPWPEDRQGFFDEGVKPWAKAAKHKGAEPEDAFIGDLLERAEIQKHARRNVKKGFPVTLVLYTGRFEWGGWSEVATLGLKRKADVPAALKRHSPDAYEVA